MLVTIEIKVFRHVNIPFTFLKKKLKIYLKNFDNIAGLRVDKKYKNRSCKNCQSYKTKFLSKIF